MATRIIDDAKLQSIAVAIQAKDNGGQMTVDEMPTRIENIPTGGTLISKTITENGTYNASADDADGYSSVDVNIADKFAGLIDNTISGEVVIPDGVTTIPNSKFNACSLITKLTMPDTITSIGVSSFQSCSGLLELRISGNIASVGNAAFSGIARIEKIDVGNIDSWLLATQNTTNLLSGANNWNLYINGELVKNIVLTSNQLTKISQAFYRCRSIESLIMPNTVEVIQGYAFQSCISLKAIAFSASLQTIGNSAFDGCSALEIIDCTNLTYTNSTVNTTLGSNAFRGTTCPIEFSDEATMNVYKNATNWSSYASRMTYTGA